MTRVFAVLVLIVLLIGCTPEVEFMGQIARHIEHRNGFSLTGYRRTVVKQKMLVHDFELAEFEFRPDDNAGKGDVQLPADLKFKNDIRTWKIGGCLLADSEDLQTPEEVRRRSVFGFCFVREF
jgi:hypothetical protein